MKILICIASYGTHNRIYLDGLLEQYRAMPHQIHLVVITEAAKAGLGNDVEQIVGLPTENPWSLPFGHKKVFVDRVEDYDLFIYCEDDVPFSQRNIEAFLQASEVLPESEIAGFLRTEVTPTGQRFYPDVHGHHRWEPESLVQRGPYKLAFFSNEHSGCYILTQKQLRKVIASGGYLAPPRLTRHGLPETAATDVYTQCGLRKLIPISHLEDFLVPHLPNKYIGRLGLSEGDLLKELETLTELNATGGFLGRLICTETKLARCSFSHDYYEVPDEDLLSRVPASATSVLSIGCGWGATEQKLIDQGKTVVGLALDAVIARLAADRGVRMIFGTMEEPFQQLHGERFDCVLISNLLHLWPKPVDLLRECRPYLSAEGIILFSSPYFSRLRAWVGRSRGWGADRNLNDYQSSGCHRVTSRLLRAWLKEAGLQPVEIAQIFPLRYQWAAKIPFGQEFSTTFVVAARSNPELARSDSMS